MNGIGLLIEMRYLTSGFFRDTFLGAVEHRKHVGDFGQEFIISVLASKDHCGCKPSAKLRF